MTGLLKRLFGGANPAAGEIDYARARELANHADAKVRRTLAGRTDVRPEILYYLAADAAPDVRREIAANRATPPHAYKALAADRDEDVRYDLALRIARLTPELSQDERDRVRQLTVEALEILARDQVIRVRHILSETLKDVANAPAHVIAALARDPELEVAAPVLQYSPILTDADLLEIIANPSVAGAIGAIARRAGVSEMVADAVAHSEDWEAVSELLANPSAQIREETLDQLVDGAREVSKWQMPIARRPLLPARAARKLASFVADAVLGVLMRRSDLDEETAAVVGETVRRRMEEGAKFDGAEDDPAPAGRAAPAPSRKYAPNDPQRIAEDVARLEKAGELNEARIGGELTSGNRVFVSQALAVKTGLPVALIERIASARSAKAMTALAWKAGLSMRFCIKLQSRYANVPSSELLHPRDGFDFPLSPEDMLWQINFYAG